MTVGRDSVEHRDRIATGALFAASLAVYFTTASAHLVGGDNAEFVTLFAYGGVAHPSGYPLYVILLRLCAWMPGGAVLGSSRVSAVLGALSIAALYRACRAWGASSTPSLVAATLYAVSPLAWRLATQAEVFALHALLASLLLWVAGPAVALAPARRVVLLAGLAGVALSNHETIVLLAPVGIWATTRALVDSPRRLRVGSLAAASFGAGLLPYLYCYAVGRTPNGRYVWGEPGTWAGLLRHVTRVDFGTFSLTAGDQAPHGLSNVGLYFEQTAKHALVWPLAIGLLGFWRTHARASTREAKASGRPSSGDVLALLATWALAGPVFASFLDVEPGVLGATLVERFRLLPEVVFAIAFAWGLDGWRGLRETRALPVALVVVASVATGAVHSWPQVQAEHTNVLELYTENTERSAPPRAVILGTGDYRLFSFIYADATKLRPDVTYVDPHLLGFDWYRARVSHELGAPIPEPAQGDAIGLADEAFALGRPVLLTDVFLPRIVKVFPSYPLGTLIRLLPRGSALPAPESVEGENLDLYATFERCATVVDDGGWASSVLPTYERPWVALSRLFERRGDEARARANAARAEDWRFLRGDAP
jgi:hypothetical protein